MENSDKPRFSVRIPFPISIVDAPIEEERDRRLAEREEVARGKRAQPPMTDRLRAVTIYVEYLEAHDIPFATARQSKMNKAVRAWLNKRMRNSIDPRKSRRKIIGEDAVRDLLKQVASHRGFR